VHDLGGRAGFGPVEVEADEPTFHEEWEAHTFACMAAAAMAGHFNTPMFRHAIERMDAEHYLNSSYYEHWLTGAATLLVETGQLDRDELDARAHPFPLSQPTRVSPDDVATAAPGSAPRFAIGDAVQVRAVDFGGHTRCPAYVKGRRGVVTFIGPRVPRPEEEAHRNERVDDSTYVVRFDATELWGDDAEPSAVYVDLYEHYLEPVA
jgi:nitrile hydratase subunit beta